MTRAKDVFWKGVLYMLLSAFALSFGLLFVKFGSYDYPFFWLVFARYFVVLSFIFLIVFFRRKFLEVIRTRHLKFHLLRAVVITSSQYFLFYYISKSNLLSATALRSTAPFFIPLIERVALGHRIGKSTTISLVVAGIGILLILKPGGKLFEWISLFGLASGFLWAVSQTIYGFTIRKEKVEVSIFYAYLLGTLMTLPPLFFFPITIQSVPAEAFHLQGILILVSLGFFTPPIQL